MKPTKDDLARPIEHLDRTIDHLDRPIEHLEDKRDFLESVHDALTSSKKVNSDRKNEIIRQTEEEMVEYDNAIEILKDHQSDEEDNK